jgi:hypothetical protein
MDIVVTAEILPGKPDPAAEARFVNGSRAGQYAQMLADSGDYSEVKLRDSHGDVWVISPST